MSGLTRLALRSLRARLLRTTLTVVGVALGVAVLFAALATGDGIAAAADRTVQALVGRADLRVAAFSEAGLSQETYAAITSTPGVAVVAPALERRTYIEGATADGRLPPSVTILGIDPAAEPRLHDLTLIAGRPLTGTDEPSALIDERLAAADGLTIGSTVSVLGAAAPAEYEVVGILASGAALGASDGRTVVVPLRTAQAVFDQVGLTRVDIGLAPGSGPGRCGRRPGIATADRAVRDLDAAGAGGRPPCLDGRLPGDDRPHRRDRALRRRVPDLQHALDDRAGADARGRAAPGGGRDPRPGPALHPRPGGRRRHRRVPAGPAPGRPPGEPHDRVARHRRLPDARSAAGVALRRS